ncbi:MAG: YqaJ viral recombinase family protein [Burkholderiaceae bacterium]
MKTVNLIQGSAEWLAHRMNHFNASDAPAMMGVSPHKTRAALLLELHTGLTADVDAFTQRLYDSGHAYEANARPLAEEIVGEDLYPVVGTLGKKSASFDGLTLMEDIAFEHKRLNEELSAAMVDGCTGSDLPDHYQVQMEQQCMVSGCDKVLFMATKWNGDDLVEERHCWYEPNPELAARIEAGWAQLEADLTDYAPPVAEAPKPTGRAPQTLPALRIEVTGSVTASNLDAFRSTALAVFKSIKRELKTDEDFANAEQTVKWCGEVEERLAGAKQHALSQTESIDVLFRTIDEIGEEARRVRLDLDKLVKAEKDRRKIELVSVPAATLREHIASLNTRLGHNYMPAIAADFAGAIKGKKSFDSMQAAVDQVLANAKIEANSIADRIQINLGTLRELAGNHKFLFNDTAAIVMKQPEDLTSLVKSRIADHKAEEDRRAEAQREQIRREEEQRLAGERAKMERAEEQRRSRIHARFVELECRLHFFGRPSLEIDAALLLTKSNAPSEDTFGERLEEAQALQVRVIESLEVELIEARRREADIAAEAAARAAAAAPAPAAIVPVAAPVAQVRQPQPAPEPAEEEPTLKISDINSAIKPFSIDAAGMAQLGFVGTKRGAATLFKRSDLVKLYSKGSDLLLTAGARVALEKAA